MIKKILMVDDDADDREHFRKIILEIDSSIEVSFAFDGNEALEKTMVIRPDIIFLDYLMPVIDGIECLTKLKVNRTTKRIPVIMYTGAQNPMENQLAVKLGAFEIIHKGGDTKKLSDTVQRILGLALKE